jgi:hypothetical protein
MMVDHIVGHYIREPLGIRYVRLHTRTFSLEKYRNAAKEASMMT